MNSSTGSPGGERGHVVQFYQNDAILVETVRNFFAPTLRAGDSAIVIATGRHRVAFETALGAAGIDIEAALREVRYVTLDAAQTLAWFMVDGTPDVARFSTTIDAVMALASGNGRRIRVYGEMASLLREARDISSALALEGLWNGLARSRPLQLLCTYPEPSFDEDCCADEFERICTQHTQVIPGHVPPPFSRVVTGAASRVPAQRPRRILVAGDDAAAQLRVTHLLGPEFDVVAVPGGHAALDPVLMFLPDLVITHLRVPGLDRDGSGAVALLLALRADRRTQKLPVILVCTRATEATALEGLAEDGVAHIVEPFSELELAARVRSCLTLSELHDEADACSGPAEASSHLAQS